ncbi:uncharacterized protein F5147DRAFT_705557, partial [Suillus discolor]
MRMPRFLFGNAAALSLCHASTLAMPPCYLLPATSHQAASFYDCGDPRLTSLRRIHSYFLRICSSPRLTLAQVWAAIAAGCPSRGSAQITICIQSMQTFSLTLSPKLLHDSPHK